MSAFTFRTLDVIPRPDLARAARLPSGWGCETAFLDYRREDAYRVTSGKGVAIGYLPSTLNGATENLFDEEIALIKKLAEELQS
jgi:hypothetical protein